MNSGGKWAIVTGASSGIGKALALECAKGGFNVLLTGRNQAALELTAAECSGSYRVATEVTVADLSNVAGIDRLIDAILSKPHRYEMLVNNAGFGVHGEFVSSDIEQELDMLNVQLSAALKLTKAVLPSMISNRAGKILNVASVYGFAPVPYQSVYSACKAFLVSFSTSLRNELADTGVQVTVFCPGITQSNFRSRAGMAAKDSSGMTAAAAAQIAFAETLRGKHIVVPGLLNRVFVLASRILPSALFANVVSRINRIRGLPQ